MPATLELESTLTDRYQTTVPATVRLALRLGKRDKISYHIESDGSVRITRMKPSPQTDPVMDHFLEFLASDMAAHPRRLQTLDTGLIERIRDLVGATEVDLNAPLSANDE